MHRSLIILSLSLSLAACSSDSKTDSHAQITANTEDSKDVLTPLNAPTVAVSNSEKALAYVKAVESSDAETLGSLLSNEFIQHDPNKKDGLEGILAFEYPENYKVDIYRVGEEENYAFTHGVYQNNGAQIGMELFRFEDGKIAEHWSAFSTKTSNNLSDRSQIDGSQNSEKHSKAKMHNRIVHKFVSDGFVKERYSKLNSWIHEDFKEHASFLMDGREMIAQGKGLRYKSNIFLEYLELVDVYGTDGFVLAVSKGTRNEKGVVIFDLFAIKDDMISERWQVVDEVPSDEKSMNANGML